MTKEEYDQLKCGDILECYNKIAMIVINSDVSYTITFVNCTVLYDAIENRYKPGDDFTLSPNYISNYTMMARHDA